MKQEKKYKTQNKSLKELNKKLKHQCLQYESRIYQLENKKDRLIKYLEDKIKVHQMLMNNSEFEEAQIIELVKQQAYQDILERLNSGKCE